MSETQHTPVPTEKQAFNFCVYRHRERVKAEVERGAHTSTACVTCRGQHVSENTELMAEFAQAFTKTLRASHSQLVAALEAANDELHEVLLCAKHGNHPRNVDIVQAAQNKVEAALRAAREGSKWQPYFLCFCSASSLRQTLWRY